MADNHDYVALDWVKGEIEQTKWASSLRFASFSHHKAQIFSSSLGKRKK